MVALIDNAPSTDSYAASSTENERAALRHISNRKAHSLFTPSLTRAWYRVSDPGGGTAPDKRNRVFQRLGGTGIRRLRPRGGHQNNPLRGYDDMIPYMVCKLAPNSTHFTRGLVRQVTGRDYFRAVPSQNGDKSRHPLPPPQSLSDSPGDLRSHCF